MTPANAGYNFTPPNSAVTVSGASQTDDQLHGGGANLDYLGNHQSQPRAGAGRR